MLSHYHVLNARMLFPSHADTGLTHWIEKRTKNKCSSGDEERAECASLMLERQTVEHKQ